VQLHICYFITCFKTYLCCTDIARNVSDTEISGVFTVFVYWHSDWKGPCLNVKLHQACQTCWWANRSDVEPHNFKNKQTVYDTCAWEAPGLRVVLPSPCSTETEFGEMVLLGGLKYRCNRFRLNFSSRTRSQFSLLYNFLVANRTFKKCAFLNVFTVYNDDGWLVIPATTKKNN